MVTLDEVLSRLDLVRRAPHGFMARCPCHADRTPSLSVRELEGRPRCHCFGCGADTRAVCSVLGLPWDGPAEPLSDFQSALAMGRRQFGQQHRAAGRDADTARTLHRHVAELRADVMLLGDCPEAWEFAETAAELERQAWNRA